MGCSRYLFLLSNYWVGVSLPLERTRAHKLGQNLISDVGATVLESLHIRLQLSNAEILQLARKHLALLVSDTNTLQFSVVLQEEGEILEGDVDLGVAAQLTVELHGLLATGESVLVDFVLDLVRGVVHVDS